MVDMQADWIIYAAALLPTAMVAGYVRGLVGFGGPLILLPVMNLFHAPVTSVSIALAVNLVANVKLIPDAWRHVTRRVSLPLAVGSVFAVPVGSYALLLIDAVAAKRIISGTILFFALILLSGWRYRGSIGAAGYVGLGALSGFILGATAVAIQTALFLNTGRETALQNRANFVVWSFYTSIIVIAILGLAGDHAPTDAWTVLFLMPVFLIGVFYGTRAYKRLADEKLRRLTTALIAIMALIGLLA